MNKKILGLGLVLALVAMMVMPMAALADTTSLLSGSFVTGNATPVLGTVAATNPMTPQMEWMTITVPVSDASTIANVSTVKVTLYYDATKAHGTAPTSADVKTCAIFTWSRGGTYVLTGPGSTTWGINVAGCSKPVDSASSGDWVFSFKVGEVATETTTSSGWDIFAEVTDLLPQTISASLYDVSMNWYGGVTTSGTLNWGTVTLGTGFGDSVNKITGISATYISNGNYSEQIQSGATWTGSGSNTATFDDNGTCSSANTFSLMACRSNTFGSAVQVKIAGATLDNTGTQTTESPPPVSTNTFWLKMASSFTPSTYTGNVTFIIAIR